MGQKKGFRHRDDTKASISATLKVRGQPNWLKQVRSCGVCGEVLRVTNHAQHVKACKGRAKYAALADMTFVEIKIFRMALRRYGLSIDDYFDLLKKQGGGCAICGVPDRGDGKRLVVDHCHETGVVRGLLCFTCNVLIGCAKDREETLRKAAAYIERTDARSYERDGWDSATSKRKVA